MIARSKRTNGWCVKYPTRGRISTNDLLLTIITQARKKLVLQTRPGGFPSGRPHKHHRQVAAVVSLGINLPLLVQDKDVCLIRAKDYFRQGEHRGESHHITILTLAIQLLFHSLSMSLGPLPLLFHTFCRGHTLPYMLLT